MAGKVVHTELIEADMLAPPARSARGGVRWLVGLVALALLFGAPQVATAAAPLRAEFNASIAKGFARLVLTLPQDVEAEVKQANNILVISFKQPIEASVDRVVSSLPGYVSVARRDPDGMAVRFALARKVTVNTMSAGEKLYIDLLPDKWVGLPPGLPQEVVDDLARRAREAERRARQQKDSDRQKRALTIRVRVASLPTFTRYMFQLPEMTAVSTDREREQLRLNFDAPLKFDLADAKLALPPHVSAVESETGAESASVQFTFEGKVDIRTFREEGNFIVDVGPVATRTQAGGADGDGGEEQGPSWLPPPAAAPSSPPAQPSSTSRASAAPATPAPAAAPTTPAAAPSGSATTAPQGGPPPPTASPPAAQPGSTQRSVTEPSGAPARPAAAAPAGDPNAPVVASLQRQGDSLRIIFPFQATVSGAVFRRAGALWMVFDTAAPLDVRRLREDPTRTIRDVAIVRSGTGQAVRIKLERSRMSSVAIDENTWVVSLGDGVIEPTVPLAISRGKAASGNSVAYVPIEQPQQLHRLTDPELGDRMLVVTALAPARGLLKEYEFVDFLAMPSVHGVAIAPAADDVTVELAPERVLISRPGGLALTQEMRPGNEATLQVARPAVLDAETWKFDREADFRDRQTTLMRAIADAPEEKRNAFRREFARFYLAREMFVEAKGLLDVTLASERDNQDRAAGLFMRGIANLLLGRPEPALSDLNAPVVGTQYEAPLWRAVALSQQGRYGEAREGLEGIETAVVGMPAELQRVALQEAVRWAIEVGDVAAATRRFNDLETLGVPYEMRPRLSILSGRLAESLRRTDDAFAAYRSASESPDLPMAAQAKLRMLVLRNALRQIAVNDAIEELEMLTAGWRGDDTEIEALQLLARLYTGENRYRNALQIMRVALNARPQSVITRRIQEEAASTFDRVFLGDRGNALPPIEALALFYDFRMLTPAGRRGDEMIRRLAERLVAMDLLPQATELLQHQVDQRLQGAARAQVATRLAMIYLMSRKPDKALLVLRATRVNDLPREMRNPRLLIEARCLSEIGRHDLALEIIENLEGREVRRLRSDIHWAARHWRDAAEEIERLYGERWQGEAKLDSSERSDVLRAAIGYALADESIALDRFRRRYGPRMPEGPDRRMFDVVTAPFNSQAPEFAAIARAASSVDTLSAFLRDLRERYPDSPGAVSAAPQPGRG
jgi:tetratricopeptide (TPR) repeat protein